MFKEVTRMSALLVFSITERLRGINSRESTSEKGLNKESVEALYSGTRWKERVEVNKTDAPLSDRTPERWWAHKILKDSLDNASLDKAPSWSPQAKDSLAPLIFLFVTYSVICSSLPCGLEAAWPMAMRTLHALDCSWGHKIS